MVIGLYCTSNNALTCEPETIGKSYQLTIEESFIYVCYETIASVCQIFISSTVKVFSEFQFFVWCTFDEKHLY